MSLKLKLCRNQSFVNCLLLVPNRNILMRCNKRIIGYTQSFYYTRNDKKNGRQNELTTAVSTSIGLDLIFGKDFVKIGRTGTTTEADDKDLP